MGFLHQIFKSKLSIYKTTLGGVSMFKIIRNRLIKGLVNILLVGACFGQSWVDLDLPGAYTVAIHPDTSFLLYIGTVTSFSVGTYGSLLFSRDNGATRDTILSGLSIADIEFHPFSADTILLACGSANASRPGVLRVTRDGDAYDSTWVDHGIQLSGEHSVAEIIIHRTDPSIMLAGTAAFGAGRLWITVNGGRQWTVAHADHHADVWLLYGDPVIDDSFYYATFAPSLFESHDGGLQWTPLVSFDSENTFPSCLAINPEEPDIYFLGTNYGGLYQSSDSGENWSTIGIDICDQHIFEILIDPTNPDQMFVTTDLGIFQSLDGGITWQNINYDLEISSSRLLVLDHDSQYLYTGSHRSSLYRLDLNMVSTKSSSFQPQTFRIDIFPNPLNPSTTIKYSLPSPTDLTITIHDLLGHQIWVKEVISQSPGEHHLQWSGTTTTGQDVSSGVYIVQLTCDQWSASNKIVVLK